MTAKSSFINKNVRRTIREYILITFGLVFYSFAWTGVIIPAKVVGGGVSGMSLLIFYATGGEAGGIPLAYSIFAINAVLILIASFIIGFKFSTKTIYAVIVMAISMGLFQQWLPYNILGLGDDKLLSAILGGGVAGIGIAICFMQGGSTGGTDIIAMIVNQYRTISYGKVILACDFVIIGLSYFIGHDITTVIYSYVVVGVTGYTLDAVMAGKQESSQLMIISKSYETIADRIVNEVNRGVTVLNGEGWYAKQPTKVLMVLCKKSETSVLFRIVKDIDPDAFITVGNVMGVYGRGFEPLKNKVPKNG